MTLPNLPKSMSLDPRDVEQTPPSQAPPHQLRRNRAPRFRCGTCGSRNCSCLNLVEERTRNKRLAWGADAPVPDLVDKETLDDYPQHKVLAIQAKHQEISCLVMSFHVPMLWTELFQTPSMVKVGE